MLLAVHYRVMEHLGSLESTQEARVALGYAYPPVPKRRQFPTFSQGLEFLNEAEKEKLDNRKGDSTSVPSRFASLFEGEMQF